MHLENKRECIYHKLGVGVEKMEQGLGSRYGTKITLYPKDSNATYQEMYRIIYRQTRTIPNFLVMGGKSNLEDRKWATSHFDRGRAEELLRATMFSDRRERFLIEFSDRMGEG